MRTACNWPGCPESVAIGIRYCEAHQAQVWREQQQRRGDDYIKAHRFYNSARWKRLRTRLLAEEPFCPMCRAEGVVTPATEVHHADGNRHNNRRDNLTSLCQSHHSQITRAETMRGVGGARSDGE